MLRESVEPPLAQMSDQHTPDSLFPTPSPPPSLFSPARWAGITPQTVQVLKKVLRDNHEKWHIFFNDRGFSKCVFSFGPFSSLLRIHLASHAVHRTLALWALGADSALIEAGYETDSSYQRETHPSPNAITHENFKNHLDDPKYVNNHPSNLAKSSPMCVGTGAPIWSSSRGKF